VARDRLFTELAEKQASALGADGIYVWILKSPPRVEVVVGPKVPAEAFGPRNRERLRDELTPRFGRSPGDRHLRDSLAYVQGTLDSAGRPVVWPWALGIIGVVLALWLVIGLLRSREQQAGSQTEQASSARITGGLLGGMFGTSGGLWIYQSLFARGGPPADGAAPAPPPPIEAPEENSGDAGSVIHRGDAGAGEAEPGDLHARSDGGTE
jgi:hypothetical protein